MIALLAFYVLVTALLLFVALFGRSALFTGTFVERAHRFISGEWFEQLVYALLLQVGLKCETSRACLRYLACAVVILNGRGRSAGGALKHAAGLG